MACSLTVTVDLAALCFRALEPLRLADYWSGVLGWAPDGDMLLPDSDAAFPIRFLATTAARTGKNLMHLDLTSTTAMDQRETVERALRLGGAGASTSARGRRSGTWCWPTPRATSSA